MTQLLLAPLIASFGSLFAFSLARLWQADIWYSIPMIVAVSLVYSATRHESNQEIFSHAIRTALWIAGFMIIMFGVITIFSSHL